MGIEYLNGLTINIDGNEYLNGLTEYNITEGKYNAGGRTTEATRKG